MKGIDGRPILEGGKLGERHLAYRHHDRWYTWCGQPVQEDHMCPSLEELSKRPVWGITTSCAECYDRYTRNDVKPIAGVPAPYSPYPDEERAYKERMRMGSVTGWSE